MTWATLLYSLPPALTAALLVILAVVPLLRGRPQAANRIFMLLCLFGSLLNLDILVQLNAPSAEAALRSSRLGHILHPFLLPLFIHFFHAYLKIQRRKWLVLAVYVYAVFLSACSQSDLMISGMQRFSFGYSGQGGLLYPLMAFGAVFTTIYNLFILHQAIGLEKQSSQKNRLKYIFTGFVVLGIMTCLNMLTRFGLAIYPPGNFGFIPLAVFAAGMFRHDLLDMGAAIRKGLLYSIVTGMLTGVYALVILAAQKVFARTWPMDSILFAAALFGLIAFIFGPVRNRIQKIIDQLFARGRYDYQQTIKQASRTIASVLDYEAITRLLRETIVNAMQVAHCILFLHDRRDHRYHAFAAAGKTASDSRNLVFPPDKMPVAYLLGNKKSLIRSQLLSKAHLEEIQGLLAAMSGLDAELVLPMIFKNRLNGFIVLGEKTSGEMYSVEDLDLLETLCLSSALAIENARAYQALNKLNRTLEIKVVERTRDLKKALEEKERTQEQLIRSESLASLGQLVAGAAHELNNPLASVTSLLQSTVEELESWEAGNLPDEALIDDLNFAGRELARAKSIVASLLGLARQTQTYTEAVNLNVVAKDALRVLHNQYKHTGVEFSEDYEDGIPTVQGNFANLGQVMLNIIKNAIQAVDPEGGRIFLRTQRASGNCEVVFVCRDNGPGIAAAISRDVFKPFFTTKPVGQGTGLGLYICHEIIRRHGGTIELDSAHPQGTVVTVRLPVGQQGP